MSNQVIDDMRWDVIFEAHGLVQLNFSPEIPQENRRIRQLP